MEIKKSNSNKINGKVLFAIKCDNKVKSFIDKIPTYEKKVKFIKKYYGININRVIDIENFNIDNENILCILVYQEKVKITHEKIEIVRTAENEKIDFELLEFDNTKISVEQYISYLNF